MPNKRLPAWGRLLALAANLGLGGLPSLAFFVWIERNCSLPWYQLGLRGWPWIQLLDVSTGAILIWNSALFAVFGILHSGLAQPGLQKALQKLFPVQVIRTLYMAITGLSVVLIMGAWQNTGIVLWSLPLSQQTSNIASLMLYWGLLLASWSIASKFDGLSFIGLRQIYQRAGDISSTEGTGTLITTGIYARVRHPIYTFTLGAVLLAPTMSLDRFWIFLLSVAYLAIGIPLEERKLIRTFGKAYENYRRQVPAVIPKIFT